MDWSEAVYAPSVRVGSCRTAVKHSLRGAKTLVRLIEKGAAAWAIEVRCPRTLMARTELSSAPEQVLEWDKSETIGNVFVLPGLMATEGIDDLASEELHPIWQGYRLYVPSGWWLVRGNTRRVNTIGKSLLRFRPDPELPKGTMEVSPVTGTDPYFSVKLATDIFRDATHDRSLQVAALIGACGHFPTVFKEDGPHFDHPIAEELRHRLTGASVPLWTDDAYDPALAATAIEPFRPSPTAPGDTHG